VIDYEEQNRLDLMHLARLQEECSDPFYERLRWPKFRRFFELLDEKAGSDDLPDWLIDNWGMLGNAVHQIIGCSCVYLMQCRERGSDIVYIKAGKARNVKDRMVGVSTGCPLELRKAIYFCVIGDGKAFELERAIHEAFSVHRINGEWFMFETEKEAKSAVFGIIKFAENLLGDDYHSFIHDKSLEAHEHMPGIRGFVHALWKRAQECGENIVT